MLNSSPFYKINFPEFFVRRINPCENFSSTKKKVSRKKINFYIQLISQEICDVDLLKYLSMLKLLQAEKLNYSEGFKFLSKANFYSKFKVFGLREISQKAESMISMWKQNISNLSRAWILLIFCP